MSRRIKCIFRNQREKLAELYINFIPGWIHYTIKSFINEPEPSVFQVEVARPNERKYELTGPVHRIGYNKDESGEITGADINGYSRLIINSRNDYEIYYVNT
jgi:hypothetical protein